MRGVVGSAATAMLSRFASTPFSYFDAIPPMFRFTIRDVLCLMVVAAVVCVWWMERAKSIDLQAKNANMRTAIESAGYVLDYAGPNLSPKR